MSERVVTVGGNKATRPITDFSVSIATEYYVGPNATGAGDDGRAGKSKETSLATLQAAIDLATASKNDIVYLLPGHTETVATAGAIDIDKIGLRVINLGIGALAATFTFSATDATITMTAASCSIEGFPILKPSVDLVVSPVVVSAADCKVDVYLQDMDATHECLRAVLTTDAADRLDTHIKYRGFIAGDGCDNAIRLVGVDTARVKIDFYGKCDIGIVEFHTTNCHDIIVTGDFYNESVALTKNVVDSQTSTWSVVGYDSKGDAAFSGGDNKSLAYADIETIASDLVVLDGIVDTMNGLVSDIETLVSDTKVDSTEILSDLETVKSDLLLADLVIDKIYSDSGNIRTDVTEILSDLETVKSDLLLADLVVDQIYSDSSNIRTDVTEILSDLETVRSDLLLADLVVDQIYSDSGNIRTDVTEILSDLETIGSDLIIFNTELLSDIETIASDLVAADLVIDDIYSDTAMIRSDTVGIMSDLETLRSDLASTLSDLKVLDALFNTYETKYASDITCLISDIATKT